jgi:hypothetical protein
MFLMMAGIMGLSMPVQGKKGVGSVRGRAILKNVMMRF